MEWSWALESGIQLKESWIPLKLEYRIQVPLSKAGIQYLELVSTVNKWAFIDLFLTLILCRWRKELHIRVRQEKHRAGNGTKDHKTNKRRYLEIMIKKKKLRLQNFILVLYIGAVTPIFQFPPRTALFRRGGQVHRSLLFKATMWSIRNYYSQWLAMHYAGIWNDDVSTSKAGSAPVAFCYIFQAMPTPC